MSFFTNLDTMDVNFAQAEANHNFIVERHGLITINSGICIPDKMAIIDRDNNRYLGTVGVGWEPVQPDTLYELAQELLNNTENSKINGAFSVRNGSVIGISFELAQRQYIPEDNTILNFMMVTGFDGTHGIAGYSTMTRFNYRCNTSGHVYNLRHTKNVFNRLEVVKNILKYYNNEIVRFDDKMNKMVHYRMNDQAAIEWFRSLFPDPKSNRASRAMERQVSIFIDCLHNGEGVNITGVKGTCYGAFQALTQYINDHRSTRIHNDRDEDEVRFESIHFGSANTIVQKGLNSILSSFGELSEDDFLIK